MTIYVVDRKSSSHRKFGDDGSSTVTSSTTISTADMQAIVERLRGEGNRSSTRMNYYTIWKKFNQFVIKLDFKPDSWEERLVLFVGYLVQNKRKSSTIKSYISAIRSVLRDDGENLCENKYLLTSLTKACRYVNDQVRTRLPIRKPLLMLILEAIDSIFTGEQPYLSQLYKTLFSTCYYGLFRVGEVTDGEHAVRARDVHIGVNKKKMLFVLHTSKTHWLDAKPQTIKISSQGEIGSCEFCPFKLLNDYIEMRGNRDSDDETFFVFSDKTAVSAVNFRLTLRKVLKTLQLDETLYSPSSFRAGRAVDLDGMQVSLESIKILGRWRSSAVFTYLKHR